MYIKDWNALLNTYTKKFINLRDLYYIKNNNYLINFVTLNTLKALNILTDLNTELPDKKNISIKLRATISESKIFIGSLMY